MLLLLMATSALPTWLSLPPQAKVNEGNVVEEVWGEAAFPITDAPEPQVKRGRHWSFELVYSGLPEDTSGKALLAKLFEQNPVSATLHATKGRDAWLSITLFSATDIRAQLVEVAPQKLSDARAQTVMQWLVAHGVAATRLRAKGYGKSKPIASNDEDVGRAKNRRVELACAR